MREIKFRCYDTLDPKMYTGHSLSISANGSFAYLDTDGQWKNFDNDDRIKVMQYTGLKDKNGKEIYEGDIFIDSVGNVIKVIWRIDLASFALESEKWAYDHYFGEAVDAGNIEIMGNIYENTELING